MKSTRRFCQRPSRPFCKAILTKGAYDLTHTCTAATISSKPQTQSGNALSSSPPVSGIAARPPPNAPKPTIDIKEIRANVETHAQNCRDRKYHIQAAYPAEIVGLFAKWLEHQKQAKALRERQNILRQQIASAAVTGASSVSVATGDGTGERKETSREQMLAEAKDLKAELASTEAAERTLTERIEALALAIPNMTCDATPKPSNDMGKADEPRVLGYVNSHLSPSATNAASSEKSRGEIMHYRSHVEIGKELGILDFAAAATASGWGWYYLVGAAAELEHALVQYALHVVTRHRPSELAQEMEGIKLGSSMTDEKLENKGGLLSFASPRSDGAVESEDKSTWLQVSPPSMVYTHVAAACGFQPRDQNNETQVYQVAQDAEDTARGVPGHCLAGTAEIALAAMRACCEFPSAGDGLELLEQLPAKVVGVSRSYRAEAGARGAQSKGLYRVHEFTKAELFAWTAPSWSAATAVLREAVALQVRIVRELGLHARVLEMPASDLGASAARKIDIEVFIPSRRRRRSRTGLAGESGSGGVSATESNPGNDAEDGWGEVSSASICTDYQSRRLATRLRLADGRAVFPWTINATALAVPRVIAALLENGWDEERRIVRIPEVLRPWMNGRDTIEKRRR